ncbi:MAG: hypothetical protein COC15_01200 [Legionellales bacterium]|nr:MAG: hypothetical protein COC15_01200 [Legionellales bacterium]
MIKQFFNFLLCGGIATAAHYALLIALVELLQINAVLASSVGFLLGFLVNFILHSKLVFTQSGGDHKMLRYFSMAVAGASLNCGVMWLLLNIMSSHYLLAQICATGIVVVVNYFCCRLWVFK